MGRLKRPKTTIPTRKPALSRREQVEEFLHDWGRLVIPLGVLAVLAGLRYLGVLDDTGLGFTISVLFLVVSTGAAAWLVWREPFPRWVRGVLAAAGVLVLGGAFVPLVQTAYPGAPAFQQVVSQGTKGVPIGSEVSGFHHLEVYAHSLAGRPDVRGAQGRYHLKVAGQDVEGSFSDMMRSVRAGRRGSRAVEQKHLMEIHTVTLPEGEKTLDVIRVDSSIGPDLQVSLFPVAVPPAFATVLLVLAVGMGLFLDARFPGQTERWRLTPWFAMVAAYVAIFESAYERGAVTNAAVWSTVFGTAVGFTVGWLLTVVARKIATRLRS